MGVSTVFIMRPIATSLLMVAILLAGLLTYQLLPISSLPQVDYPVIQVTTTYPGASPSVMSSSVTAPLERQFGQMSGLNQMTSSSSNGYSSITLQFTLNTALDVAEQEVQAAINAATNYLPTGLPSPPIYSKINPADTPIITLALTSTTLPLHAIEDYAETRLTQKLSQVSGVGLVSIRGGHKSAIRVQVDSNLLASFGISLDQVRQVIDNTNVNGAKGNLDGKKVGYTINANDQLISSEDYGALIIAYVNNAPVRLRDVATIIESAENIRQAAWVNKTPAIIVNIQRQPGANVIKVADTIKELLPKLSASLPHAIKLEILNDRTQTIRASVHDVTIELTLAIILVIIVIFLFLRTFSATIIPSIAVPLSLIGSFSFMYLMGYSLNNLSLMALTIATGFVVDDAIVMIENISRYIEEGMKPFDAAIKGAAQIGFTIISLTISLIAVLIPLFFMQDIIGRLFKEFAVTLAIAILISGFVSLTLTPMLCSRILKLNDSASDTKVARYAEKALKAIIEKYSSTLKVILKHQAPTLIFAVLTFVITIMMFYYIPKGFFPVQDTGMIQGISQADANISFDYMSVKQQELADIILEDKDVDNLSSYIGIDNSNPTINKGNMLIKLKDKRSANVSLIITRLNSKLEAVVGAHLYLQPVEDINLADQISNAPYLYSIIGQNPDEVAYWSKQLKDKLSKVAILKTIGLDEQNKGLQIFVDINRDKAANLGITVAAIDDAIYNMFGQRQISTIFTERNQYKVILEGLPSLQQNIEAMENIYLTSSNGAAIPLKSFASISQSFTPLLISRQNQFSAATIYFDMVDGSSLSASVAAVEKAKQELNMPSRLIGSFQGTAAIFKGSTSNQLILIIMAIIVVYIVLGVLYESYIHPVTILSTLPSACMGALLCLWITGSGLDVIGIIGIVLLIGIVKKNAIMMIDFALEQERIYKKSPEEAIFEACILRFRPILMTTMCAILGAVPLVTGLGIGSEIRQPLGIAIIGGLIVSQLLTLYTTPVIYLAFDRLVKTK